MCEHRITGMSSTSERDDIRCLPWANTEPLKFKIQRLWANHNIFKQIMHLLHAVYFGLKL